MSKPRPDSAPAPGADTDRTVRLAPADGAVDGSDGSDGSGGAATVRLGPGAAAPERTVRLDRPAGAPATGGPDAEATVGLEDTEAASATFLDPRAWGGAPAPGESVTLAEPPAPAPGTVPPAPGTVPPAPGADPSASAVPGVTAALGATAASGASPGEGAEDDRPFAPGELRRFGPGVPPQAAAVWHGRAVPGAEQPRRRRALRWLVPVAVAAAVLAFLFWRFQGPALEVTGVGVTTADPAGPGCGGTAVVTAVLETRGGAGTVRYRWLRSDGTTSGEIRQDVRSGTHRTELVLRWSFEGRGSFDATATLEILAPQARTAATSFPYRCP
ncbi:hypothetical protein [Kitasatospora sp. NBC_00458]|uniref:hypothetical protein n=1 Tax=Kitasatospora sp. NBC_00458 TaxID=2903568 RepID=UPI002E190806